MRIAFATHSALPRLHPQEHLAIGRLATRGIEAIPAVWDGDGDWSRFDAVVLRACWDYHRKTAAFLAWLAELERRDLAVINAPSLVRWNLDKSHLVELYDAGAPVVPSVKVEAGTRASLRGVLDRQGWSRAVIKPTVSLSAEDTHRVDEADAAELQPVFDALLLDRDLLVQRYVDAIETAGELSLVFFAGRFSHAVKKLPQRGDFRTQREHGGLQEPCVPEPGLVDRAAELLARAPGSTSYARVDGVVIDGTFTLMELELIDPELYLNEHTADRFARSILDALR